MNSRPESLGKCLRFGAFELDMKAGELRKHGIRIRLQEQPLKLLFCLVEKPGTIISRQELAAELWPAGTFVDYEHGLNAAVTRLRQVLRDSADSPRYIETVARRGYRFVAPVTEMRVSETELSSEAAESGSKPRLASVPTRLWLALGTAAISVALLSVFLLLRPASTPPYYSAVPLTSEEGAQLCPSFSPDGDRVAFSWEGEKQDNLDIYVKQIGGGAPLRLTTDPGADLSPAWSPDGRSIAFVRLSPDNTAEVALIPSFGRGAERRLAQVAAPPPDYRDMRLLSWSPDGRWLALADSRSTSAPFSLYLLSVDTGTKRRLTFPPVAYDDFDPAFSPDGRHLAFVRRSGATAGDIYVLEVPQHRQALGEPKQLTFDYGPISSPVWADHGRALLFTRYGLLDQHSLWKIILSRPAPVEPLPIAADNAVGLALSLRGDRLVYTRQTKKTNIWAVDLPAVPSARGPAMPRPWLVSSQEAASPSFSPDGEQVAFQSSRSGWSEIWLADRDGSHLRQMTELSGSIAGFPHWSPDGKRIVFHSRQHTYARLFLLDISTARAQPLAYPAVDDFLASWSHDGKWIYFSSRRSGDMQVWKVRPQGGPAMQVTKHGGEVSLESVDGQYLFYTKLDKTLWRMPLLGGEEQQVSADAVSEGWAYIPARSGVYFIREAVPGGKRLVFLHLPDGQETTLAKTPRALTLGMTVSPDERMILYNQVDDVSSELMLVDRFR
jgi:Tol biopolymer transport system component/DNA-binding winged helix-turn-helix (wHTH) protein